MKKRISSLLLVIAMISTFVVLPTTSSANAYNGLYYEVSNEEVTIKGYFSSIPNEITIPNEINGYPVTAIGDNAFFECQNLVTVTLPDSVTSIGTFSFALCTNLKSITISDSITSIGTFALAGCIKLTQINVDENNDYFCSVDGNLFSKNKRILVQYALGKSSNTYTVHADEIIAPGALAGCVNLTKINVDEGNIYYDSVDGNLFSKDLLTLIQYAAGKSSNSYVVPDSVTTIDVGTFGFCTALKNITLPQGITQIGAAAFGVCSSLKNIDIPESVNYIGMGAFFACESLATIDIPDRVTTIEDFLFCYCTSLESITIPDSVTSIGNRAFLYCDKLTNAYYAGSKSDWNDISIGFYNGDFTSATIHYNCGLTGSDFPSSAYEYSHLLARKAFELTTAGFSAVTDYGAKSDGDSSPIAKKRYANIKKEYDKLGLTDNQKFYNYGINLLNETDKAAYSIASKNITIDGQKKRLVVLVVRGSGYGGEWASNFNVGTNKTYSEGFKIPADKITNTLKNYIKAYSKEEVVLLMTSFSRGAAITNLVAANMDDYADSCSYISRDKIYAYTFATPRPVHVQLAGADDEKYNNIFNIVNPVDVVPCVPLAKWGFGRYGVTKTFFTNPPSAVKSYYKELTGNKYSLSAEQKEAASAISSLLYTVAGTKSEFNKNYQDVVQDFISWLMVYKEAYPKKSSLIDYLLTKYDKYETVACYQRADATVTAYKNILKKAGAEAYIDTLRDICLLCEVNGTSAEELLEKILEVDLLDKILVGEATANSIHILNIALPALSAKSNSKNGFDIKGAHEPDTYRAWLFGTNDTSKIYITGNQTAELLESNANKYKSQLIQCPVDVEVTDKDGNVVVSVVNHEVLVDELPVVVLDDKVKIYYHDNFDEYTTKITAYEDGNVNYYVSEYASGTDETKRISYTDISVASGDVLSGSINDEINTDVSNYDLTLLNSETTAVVENSELLEGENLENLSADVTVEGSGNAGGVYGASKGDYITLTAEPLVGAEFVGWYNGEECLSAETTYSFVIDKNYSLTAKFTTATAVISDIDIVTVDGNTVESSVKIAANSDIEGVLTFTTFCDEEVVETYDYDINMSQGEEKIVDFTSADDGLIDSITACLYAADGTQMTELLSAYVIRNVETNESDGFIYKIYNDRIELIGISDKSAESIIIPESISNGIVSIIGENLFEGVSAKKIIIPSTVSTIKNGAFSSDVLEYICYKGTIEQWECTAIADDALGSAQVIYNYDETVLARTALFESSYVEGNVTANIDLEYIFKDCTAVIAVYDESGKLINVVCEQLKTSDTPKSVTIPVDIDSAPYSAKLMLWENVKGLKPIGTTSLCIVEKESI